VIPGLGLLGSSSASLGFRSVSLPTVCALRRPAPVRVLNPKNRISRRASPKCRSISVTHVSTRAFGTRINDGANVRGVAWGLEGFAD
jgi:hypothetical protein